MTLCLSIANWIVACCYPSQIVFNSGGSHGWQDLAPSTSS